MDVLRDAWEVVQANDLEDDVVSPGVARFAETAIDRLETISAELANGVWTPGDLTLVKIPKRDGSVRVLHIPRVEDRIVARAVLNVVMPFVDPELGPAAFAYRPGLGVGDAVRQVVGYRSEGLVWVFRTDIDECFPTLPTDLALRRLAALVPSQQIAGLVRRLGERAYRSDTGTWRIPPGVPQGCPLSPMLANLVLVTLDDALLAAGFPVVRYADDLTVFALTEEDAWEAARVTSEAAEALGMQLGADKSQIMSFADGFSFLGEDFNPRYPPAVERVAEPDERALYVARVGGRVRVDKGRVKVMSKNDETLLDVAQTQVSRVVCFGSVGLTAGARTWALANDIDIVLASRSGNYLGTILSHEDRYRPERLRAQLGLDASRVLELSRAFVEAKIRKQRVLLQRANRRRAADDTREAIGQLAALLKMIPDTASVPEVLGVEGAAARFYFPALGRLLPADMQFQLRSRRPPMDVANAALSFLYTVLLGECVTALHAVGLDPCIGVLHADQNDRPSLALDLLEEFRPLVADEVVHRLAVQKALTPQHGRPESGGVWLTAAGRETVLAGYEARMLQPTSALPGFSGTIRRHLYRQAQRLRNAILGNGVWTGLSWR